MSWSAERQALLLCLVKELSASFLPVEISCFYFSPFCLLLLLISSVCPVFWISNVIDWDVFLMYHLNTLKLILQMCFFSFSGMKSILAYTLGSSLMFPTFSCFPDQHTQHLRSSVKASDVDVLKETLQHHGLNCTGDAYSLCWKHVSSCIRTQMISLITRLTNWLSLRQRFCNSEIRITWFRSDSESMKACFISSLICHCGL